MSLRIVSKIIKLLRYIFALLQRFVSPSVRDRGDTTPGSASNVGLRLIRRPWTCPLEDRGTQAVEPSGGNDEHSMVLSANQSKDEVACQAQAPFNDAVGMDDAPEDASPPNAESPVALGSQSQFEERTYSSTEKTTDDDSDPLPRPPITRRGTWGGLKYAFAPLLRSVEADR